MCEKYDQSMDGLKDGMYVRHLPDLKKKKFLLLSLREDFVTLWIVWIIFVEVLRDLTVKDTIEQKADRDNDQT